MGPGDAAVIIAAILQKGEAIGSPGGYLRALSAKARAKEFSIGPVLMALLRGKLAKAGARAKCDGIKSSARDRCCFGGNEPILPSSYRGADQCPRASV